MVRLRTSRQLARGYVFLRQPRCAGAFLPSLYRQPYVVQPFCQGKCPESFLPADVRLRKFSAEFCSQRHRMLRLVVVSVRHHMLKALSFFVVVILKLFFSAANMILH